jgi:proteasome lid subunit RPN8/RPN11
MPLSLTSELLAVIHAEGESAFPYECCGFLIGDTLPFMEGAGVGGDSVGDESRVLSAVPATNTRGDSPSNRYAIDPQELYRVEKGARDTGHGVVGIYHSHPDSPARPSEYDREHACPWYCYLIVSVIHGSAQDTRNWKLTDDGSGFIEDPIITRGE